jgi:LCP family protein required for cell wall assembly
MSVIKPSRGRRVLDFVLFRLVPALLLIGILYTAFQIAQSVSRYFGEQAQAAARAPLYVQTATALALNSESTPEATEVAADGLRLAKRVNSDRWMQEFATNTPQPIGEVSQAAPTPDTVAAPTLDLNQPTRPLPTPFFYDAPDPNTAAATAIPTPVEPLDRQGYDLMNILLLGNDAEITGDQVARTDTMIVVSINRTTGTVAMLTLPRDLYVYIPGWTMQRLNNAYVRGVAVGWTDGPFGLMRQTLLYNFGINVHYYAMVDLTGFKAIVDAVGGVDIGVDCAIQDYQLLESEVPEGAYRVNEDGEYVLPVGFYHMTGAEALWYARSRGSSSDFDRGPRQMQVLRAAWRTARNQGLISQVPELWNQGIQYVQTNLTLPDILGLAPLAASLDPTRIQTYSIQRLYHTTPWTTPDGENVQLPVYETLRPLLQDFYTPPTESQIAFEAPTVAVYNGTNNPNWDRVAAESLAWEGFNADALGVAPTTDYASTVMIDYTGRSKASSLEQLATMLNVQFENLSLDPRSDRQYDFEVIIGSDYTSCQRGGVLPVDAPSTGGG